MSEHGVRPMRTILVVEDEEDHLSSWRREEDDFNIDSTKPICVRFLYATNEEEVHSVLADQRIDCAVVDLRVPIRSGEVPDPEVGKRVFQTLFKSAAMPIVLLSGHPGERSDEISDSPTLVLEKEGGAQEKALTWLGEHEPLMAALRSARQEIRSRTAAIFHGHIWKRWKDASHASADAIRRSVIRQIIAHVGEDLLLGPDGENHDLVEFYFVPPLNKDRLQTGDILRFEEKFFVVLSPRCDMARTYPETILVAGCNEYADIWKRWGEILTSGSQAKKDKVHEQLRDHATQKLEPRRHFLPPCGTDGPWIVDFASLRTIPREDARALLEGRIASIGPQFVPNLIQRFTAFAGRMGQPGLSVEQLGISARKAAAPLPTEE